MNQPKAVKIRTLLAPTGDLAEFDPGEYLCGLEFYPTEEPVDDAERNGLAQLVHFVGYLALQARSPAFATAVVATDSLAHAALQTYFGHLEGWNELPREPAGLTYRALASFLMTHYPPHLPGRGPRDA
jgi:hypothetical protein